MKVKDQLFVQLVEVRRLLKLEERVADVDQVAVFEDGPGDLLSLI